jgi:ribonuclease P protein component
MIAKRFRLTESQIGKVLKNKKPFFSNLLIANAARNGLEVSRFALILSGKVAKTSVDRNFYRRRFYDRVALYLDEQNASGVQALAGIDASFVVQKGNICERRDLPMITKFETEVDTLLRKVAAGWASLPLLRPARKTSTLRETLTK